MSVTEKRRTEGHLKNERCDWRNRVECEEIILPVVTMVMLHWFLSECLCQWQRASSRPPSFLLHHLDIMLYHSYEWMDFEKYILILKNQGT